MIMIVTKKHLYTVQQIGKNFDELNNIRFIFIKTSYFAWNS